MKTIKLIVSVLFLAIFFSLETVAQENKQNDVFFIVEEMPVYPGGEEALRNDITALVKYPVIAKEQGISGKVFITFTVDENGKVVNPRIARGVDSSLDKEALRVIGLLKTWKPGKQKGQAVKVEYTVPINFELKESTKTKNPESELDEDGNQIFVIVEEMPVFPGGEEGLKTYIMENINYPDDAKKEKIQGKVYVTFVVGQNGKILNAKIARGVHPLLDKEALRVMSNSPVWTPGKQRGKAVSVKYTVPIIFKLD